MTPERDLSDIKRRLQVIEYELSTIANPHPDNGEEITLAMRKVQEAILYVGKAEEKA